MNRHASCPLAALATATLALACAPTLKPGAHRTEHLASPERCSQGPFEIRVTATGSPHGEDLVLTAFTPRNLLGVYRVLVDGKEVQKGQFGRSKTAILETVTPRGPSVVRYEGDVAVVLVGGVEQRQAVTRTWLQQYVTVDRPENQRCVAAAGERPVADAPPPPPEPGGRPGRPVRGRPAPRPVPPDPPVTPPTAAAPAPLAFKVMTAAEARGMGIEDHRTVTRTLARIEILREGFGTHFLQSVSCSLDRPNNRFRAGADVRIQLWSAEPNDLEGVVFRLDHRVYRPSVSAEKWAKHVAKRKVACQRDQERRDARYRKLLARDQRRAARPSGQGCRFAVVERGKTGLAFRQWFERKVPCGCSGRYDDETCWGKGGYTARLAAERAARATRECEIELLPRGAHTLAPVWVTKRCACADTADDTACWGAGGLEAARQAALARLEAQREQRAAEARAAAAARLQAEPPPPPPARAEEKPPRPSDRAEWVPGYWTRTETAWAWIGGWWRVPPADVTEGRTTRATKAPPREALRETRTAAPVAGAVWIPGFWMWNGRGYAWVPGGWRIPPRPGMRWRPAHWRLTLGGAVLVPGAWVP